MDYVKAFLIGGLICALVQILMEKTKMMPGRIMVLLVVSGTILGAVGIYEPFAKWAGAGAGAPSALPLPVRKTGDSGRAPQKFPPLCASFVGNPTYSSPLS